MTEPRYWVRKEEVESRIPESHPYDWFIGFKDVTSATNERTLICTVIPQMGVGHKAPLILLKKDQEKLGCLIANLSSLVVDYVARNKCGGVSMSYFIVKQLPIIPPEDYNEEISDEILRMVLELNYTGHLLESFAKDLGFSGPPFVWDEEQRWHLKAKLDAIYALLYGLTEDEVEYILESFTTLKRREIANSKKQEFKTKKLVLEYYKEYKEKWEGIL